MSSVPRVMWTPSGKFKTRGLPSEGPTAKAFKQGTEMVQYAILDDQSINGLGKPQSTKDLLGGPSHHERLSKVLHESLPTPKDIEILAGARGRISTRFFEMTTTTYKDLDRSETKSLASFLKTPGPYAHPVLIARHMLWVATFLQHLHPHLHDETAGLSEPPRQMMKRLTDTCIRLVTMNDDLLSSFEGLECIMIESMYHTNGGDLRKGLIAIRRAIVVAQLMGFHRAGTQTPECDRLDLETRPNPSFMWYRILFSERHLCLMLGLPQSTLDQSMASEAVLATDSPMGRLERIHCTIASRILERNQSDPNPNDTALTQGLDGELRKAAENLPRKWWLAANLATASDPEVLFWDMRRLFHQLFHYNLLNQLHLPYMLCSNYTGDGNDYSRITCVNASREVLSRFMMFQSIDRIAFWCRTMYFFSLMAAMTLIMAHLDGHRRRAAVVPGLCQQQYQEGRQRRKTENLLTHQRPGDRAMVEQVQEGMEEMSRLNEDELGVQSAELLRRLLVIEAEAAAEAAGRAQRGGDATMQGPTYGEDQAAELEVNENGAVRFRIPHFGTVKIGRDGVISKELTGGMPSNASTVDKIMRRSASHAGAIDSKEKSVRNAACSSGCDSRAENSMPIDIVPIGMVSDQNGGVLAGTKASVPDFSSQSLTTGHNSTDTESGFSGSSKLINEGSLQQNEHPQTTGVDDWTLQGVDMAFFDSLMREVGDGISEGYEWLADMAT